jgi:hypothetical protein
MALNPEMEVCVAGRRQSEQGTSPFLVQIGEVDTTIECNTLPTVVFEDM